jgi:hypothetical protein
VIVMEYSLEEIWGGFICEMICILPKLSKPVEVPATGYNVSPRGPEDGVIYKDAIQIRRRGVLPRHNGQTRPGHEANFEDCRIGFTEEANCSDIFREDGQPTKLETSRRSRQGTRPVQLQAHPRSRSPILQQANVYFSI